MIGKFDGAVAKVSNVLGMVSGVVTVLLMAVILADVVHRLLRGGSLVGAYELASALLVVIVFTGISYVERADGNVKVTLLTDRLPVRVAAAVRAAGTLVALVVVLWFTRATAMEAIASFRVREVQAGVVDFPIWPIKIMVVLGFFALIFEFLVRFLKQASLVVAPAPTPAAEVDGNAEGANANDDASSVSMMAGVGGGERA
ncbi:TRAP transporter small permease subunit [Georgenia sp. SYP-B2076]|uniref:TRAP transporter small permease subunit n=1 Tax=Georgenia sp. SYP-B2076 TaxID=2495881 RepID=UPI000F8E49DC|nr:TRAP transporter small permease [Georgenia sp. SYP-B2076]